MSAAEPMAALNTVEQDHLLVLEKIQALKDCVSCLFEPEAVDLKPVLHRFREIHDFLTTRFAAHMEEEETTLFPFLEHYKEEGTDLVGRLRLEHEEIRYRSEELNNCVRVAMELEDGVPRAVLRDLLAAGWGLWELMDNHAHVETQGVHQCIARHLRESESSESSAAVAER